MKETRITINQPYSSSLVSNPIATTNTLDDEGLVAESWGEADLRHVGGLVDEVLHAVKHASPRGRNATVDATLRNRFTWWKRQVNNSMEESK